MLLKERAARELGVAEGKISINERKKVYVPKFAKLHLKVGDNTAKATVNLETGEVQFDINPLPDEHFIRKTEGGAVLKQTGGEEVVERELRREKDRVKVSGKTLRFSFEASFNPYTGKILNFEALLSDEALKELFEKEYPEGTVLNLEKGRKVAVADVLLGDGIAVVEVDMTKGTYKVAKKLLSPEGGVFNSGRKVMEANFPLRDLTMKSYRVLEHKYLELTLESPDGKAIVKMDGATGGDVLDYLVEISQERARELVAEKYPGFEIISVEENETEYRVNAGGSDRHLITVRLSRDGKLMEEVDRVLKEGGLVKKMAMERARDIDEEARIDSISLDENWNVEFTGKTKVGTGSPQGDGGGGPQGGRALHGEGHRGNVPRTPEEDLWRGNPENREAHPLQGGGYIHIKVAGREKLYYARIDTKPGDNQRGLRTHKGNNGKAEAVPAREQVQVIRP